MIGGVSTYTVRLKENYSKGEPEMIHMYEDEAGQWVKASDLPAIEAQVLERVRAALPDKTIKRLRQISEILSGPDNHHGVFLSEIASALAVLFDEEENWFQLTKGKVRMFKAGDKVFLRTVTFHLVGEIERVENDWVKLTDASWVADSGRFHKAIADGTLNEVEYVGEAFVNLSTVSDAFPWNHELPTESK